MNIDEAPAEPSAGPDLQEGIAASSLAEGGMIAGHVGEDAVLLARKGEEFFALDAMCSHYGGPLAEGALMGETVRCPWHHACFSLRTGSAVAAPGMRPLRVFTTVREGDLVRVRPDARLVPPPPIARAEEPAHIVIVGAGAAGSFAASELRRAGFGGRVTLLTRESREPYDKPNLSKDYLAGRAQPEWIPLRGAPDYAGDRVDLRLGATVDRIDPSRCEVHLSHGDASLYDRLILAPGATPRRLDIPIDPAARLFYLRTWADADALRDATESARSAVIIGSGFIGLEAAASLRERGLEITVVGRDALPLQTVLGSRLGEFVRRTHQSHGVRFRLGRQAAEIRPGSVVLDDGTVETADVVIAAIGVEPDVRLASDAGLAIDRGILVNSTLQTTSPEIFVAGDAARFPYARSGKAIRVEHWAVAGRQGQVAARNAMGHREPYTAVPFFWSQHYDLVLASVGHAENADDVEVFGSFEAHSAAAVYREGGRITAVVTLFRDDISLAIEAAMERDASDDAILDLVRASFAEGDG
ncbi:MAG TPA: FAD-dependent oxidoreductase [Thermoanaerobaculia bacterium]|nr:FAD-dependent oxidoreductase [Thermoanaerobaculia bacterium]